MSVYRDTNTDVVFAHPFSGQLTATVTRDGQTILTETGISPVSGQFTLSLTYRETQYDGPLTITWTGVESDNSAFTRTQVVQVVTPLVSLTDLRTISDAENLGDSDLIDLEALVRTMVSSYTGQTFGYSYGPRAYVGNGSGKLILKERCATLAGILGVYGGFPSDWVDSQGNTNLNGELNLERGGLIEDGWTFLVKFPELLDVRETPPMELVEFAPSQDGTIRVPRRYMLQRDKGTNYTLTGVWGYDEIPEDVHEAAMLLAADYAADDTGYRDRYLQIAKIQQDSLTFHPGAFRGTGNARVDLLLGSYRRQHGMVIL